MEEGGRREERRGEEDLRRKAWSGGRIGVIWGRESDAIWEETRRESRGDKVYAVKAIGERVVARFPSTMAYNLFYVRGSVFGQTSPSRIRDFVGRREYCHVSLTFFKI